MKTSLLLSILIILNTTALISEPLTNLISGISPWWFIGAEFLLLAGYLVHKTVKKLKEQCEHIFSEFNF